MLVRIAVIAGLAVSAMACARTVRDAGETVGPASAASLAVQQLPAQADGKAVFDAVCSSCHTVDPPANAAPPMSHVARHYRTELTDTETGITRIARWVISPAQERSLLPGHAIERWGIMPKLELNQHQANAVARYVWSLGEGAGPMGGGAGMTIRPGRDGMHQDQMGPGHGTPMQHETTAATTEHRMGMGRMMMRHRVMPDSAAGGQRGRAMMMQQGEGRMDHHPMMRHGAMADSTAGAQSMMSHEGQGPQGGMGMMGGMCPMMAGPDTTGPATMRHRHGTTAPPDTGVAPVR